MIAKSQTRFPRFKIDSFSFNVLFLCATVWVRPGVPAVHQIPNFRRVSNTSWNGVTRSWTNCLSNLTILQEYNISLFDNSNNPQIIKKELIFYWQGAVSWRYKFPETWLVTQGKWHLSCSKKWAYQEGTKKGVVILDIRQDSHRMWSYLWEEHVATRFTWKISPSAPPSTIPSKDH